MNEKMNLRKQYVNYVFRNIVGLVGVSVYLLADTFFISRAAGTNGITALNLVLPVYAVIFAIGAMIGVGSAICYSLSKASEESDANLYFSNAIIWVFIVSLPFMFIGTFIPDEFLRILGADDTIVDVGSSYIRVVMLCTPFFMINTSINAFIRNDGNPSLAMCGTLVSSIFNVIFDYILMFPCKMGMVGAGVATGVSPILGILICSSHFFRKTNNIKFILAKPSVNRLFRGCRLGIAAFIGELSSGVTTAVFNWLLLDISGNIGVAAYGIVANMALVATAIFNGVAQGIQPLVSESYGRNDRKSARSLLKMGIISSLTIAIGLLCVCYIFAETFVKVFNSEQSLEMAKYANEGIKLYFIGFLFAGMNIVVCGYLCAIGQAKEAFVGSVSRGVVAIVICAIVLSKLFGMTGVWIAFPASEAITFLVLSIILFRFFRSERINYSLINSKR